MSGPHERAGLSAAEADLTHDGPAVIPVNPAGRSPFVLLCEHASRLLPPGYGTLGLPVAEFDRHIAWDLGAAELALRLAILLDAPLFLAGYSRLVIDLNRPPGTPTSIPEISETTAIPGNIGLDDAEREQRRLCCFEPFRAAVSDHLDARQGRPTAVVGIHSFTPVFKGQSRPWEAGVLFGRANRFGEALAAAIEDEAGSAVGRNEPYRVADDYDYTVPVHGDRRGLPAVLIEIRQDLILDVHAVERWSRRLAAALAATASHAA